MVSSVMSDVAGGVVADRVSSVAGLAVPLLMGSGVEPNPVVTSVTTYDQHTVNPQNFIHDISVF